MITINLQKYVKFFLIKLSLLSLLKYFNLLYRNFEDLNLIVKNFKILINSKYVFQINVTFIEVQSVYLP